MTQPTKDLKEGAASTDVSPQRSHDVRSPGGDVERGGPRTLHVKPGARGREKAGTHRQREEKAQEPPNTGADSTSERDAAKRRR